MDRKRIQITIALISIVTIVTLFALKVYSRDPIYDLDFDDSITNVSSPTFNYSLGLGTTTEPSTPPTNKAYIYLKDDNKLYLKDEVGNETDLTAGGGTTDPGGSDTQIQRNNAGSFDGIDGFVSNGSSVSIRIQFNVSSITWSDGTVQVSSPPAGGGGGVTDHTELTSTGTVTHTGLETWLSSLDSSTGTINSTLDTITIATATNATNIDNLESSTSTLEGLINTNTTDISELDSSTNTLNGLITTNATDISELDASTATLTTAIGLNTTHRTSNGTDHTYIDQDVTTTATPTFSSGTFINSISINAVQYTWPSSDGTSGQVLHTDGAKTLSWATDDAGSGGANIDVQDGGSQIVNTSTMDFTGAEFIVTDNSGEALIKLDGSSVTLAGQFIDPSEISAGAWDFGISAEADTLTEGGVAVYNDNEMDSYSELNAIVTDVTLTHNGLIDTGAELDAIVTDVNIIVSTEIDTAAELDAIVADENIIVETEMDASSELVALIDDEIGSGNILFGNQSLSTTDSPTFANTTLTYGISAATGAFSGQVTSNGHKLVDEYDFAICISTPNALGVVATLVSPFRSYDITITTISAQIIGGTNVVFMVEQRTIAGIESAGTDIWSGDVTAVVTNWTGGATSDFTVPAGSALVLVPTSVSGDVDRLMIKGIFTKD